MGLQHRLKDASAKILIECLNHYCETIHAICMRDITVVIIPDPPFRSRDITRQPWMQIDHIFPFSRNLLGKSTYRALKNSATFFPSRSYVRVLLYPPSR